MPQLNPNRRARVEAYINGKRDLVIPPGVSRDVVADAIEDVDKEIDDLLVTADAETTSTWMNATTEVQRLNLFFVILWERVGTLRIRGDQ